MDKILIGSRYNSQNFQKNFISIFEFVGQFFFPNDNFKLKEDFSEYNYYLKRTWKFPGISYFNDLRQTRSAKKIPKTVLKTRLKIKDFSVSKKLCDLFSNIIMELEMRSKRLQTLQSRKLNKLIWKSTSTFEFLVEILLNNQNVKLKYYDSNLILSRKLK
jgi:hypothetical protein